MRRRVSGLVGRTCLWLIPISLLLFACQAAEQPTPRLTLTGAMIEMRVVNAHEIARTEHEDVTVVLFYGQQGVRDVVALVELDRASQTVLGHGTSPVAAPEPGTMSFGGDDTRLVIYGRITDPLIRILELAFMRESRLFPVSLPGYIVVMDDPPPGWPQCWQFLDADGELAYAPPGRC
jgi:hypothetical protein